MINFSRYSVLNLADHKRERLDMFGLKHLLIQSGQARLLMLLACVSFEEIVKRQSGLMNGTGRFLSRRHSPQ